MKQQKINILIVGGGRGGLALLKMLSAYDTMNIVGGVDTREDAPAITHAKELGLPISDSWKEFLTVEGLDEIIDATGSDKVYKQLESEKQQETSIMSGASAKIMWILLEEAKKREESLRFLSSVAQQVSDSILVTDLAYKITYINEACSKMFGYEPRELIGKMPDILNAEENPDDIQLKIYNVASNGKIWNGIIKNKRKNGEIFQCEVKVSPLKDKEVKII